MLFKYVLYSKPSNDVCNFLFFKLVKITDSTWHFKGKCNGIIKLLKCTPIGIPVMTFHSCDHWEYWVNIESKPWWLPYFILNWILRKHLYETITNRE